MTKSLESLNSAELNLLSQVNAFSGTIKQKTEQLEASNVFEAYAEIYDEYAKLIQFNVDGTEALKRALFLCWFEQTEPSIYTGLSGLAVRPSTRRVFETIEHRINSISMDSELEWMIHYYYSVGEWVFVPYSQMKSLQRFLSLGGELAPLSNLQLEDFSNRGQMGEYWKSVITSKLERDDFRQRISMRDSKDFSGDN